MKKLVFRPLALFFLSGLVFFIVFSCGKERVSDDLKLNRKAVVNDLENPFKRTVGAPIDGALALRWAENYNRAISAEKNTCYTIGRKDLGVILNDPACVGIGLHYAMDGQKLHILPIGVNESGTWMKTDLIPTESGMIDWETAQRWIADYKGPVASHFFGSNTFDRLFSRPCTAIWVTLGLDGENKPQLLLTRKLDGDVSINPAEPVEDRSWSTPEAAF